MFYGIDISPRAISLIKVRGRSISMGCLLCCLFVCLCCLLFVCLCCLLFVCCWLNGSMDLRFNQNFNSNRQARPEYNEEKCKLWVGDVAIQDFPEEICEVDYATLLFVLSAITPSDHLNVLKRIFNVRGELNLLYRLPLIECWNPLSVNGWM